MQTLLRSLPQKLTQSSLGLHHGISLSCHFECTGQLAKLAWRGVWQLEEFVTACTSPQERIGCIKSPTMPRYDLPNAGLPMPRYDSAERRAANAPLRSDERRAATPQSCTTAVSAADWSVSALHWFIEVPYWQESKCLPSQGLKWKPIEKKMLLLQYYPSIHGNKSLLTRKLMIAGKQKKCCVQMLCI